MYSIRRVCAAVVEHNNTKCRAVDARAVAPIPPPPPSRRRYHTMQLTSNAARKFRSDDVLLFLRFLIDPETTSNGAVGQPRVIGGGLLARHAISQ